MEIKRDQFRKTVTSPFSGQDYSIRKITFRGYLAEIGVLPLILMEKTEDQLKRVSEEIQKVGASDPEMERKTVVYALAKGVVEPQIWFGSDVECPEDKIAFADLGDDAQFLAIQIYEMSFEMAGLKKLNNFFRDAGTGADGHRGEEVRDQAVIPAAGGNAGVGPREADV